jgi:hypothetical protein
MVAYISISKHIVAGNFYSAINAYWSPLISWLMAPFIGVGINGLLAYKMLNLVAGLISLFQLHIIANDYLSKQYTKWLFMLLCVPHLLYFSLCNATPDIISLACWLLVFNHIRKVIQNPTITNAIITGLLASLSYFAKYYNFYAFILLCFIVAVYCIIIQKQIAIKYLLLSVTLFGLVCSFWMLQLQSKFGVYTPTTAAQFNINLINPTVAKQPILFGNHLLSINYSNFITTSWEYPPDYTIKQWSPFNSMETFKKHIQINLTKNLYHFRNKHVIEFVLFGVACIIFLLNYKSFEAKYWLLLCCILAYPLGYFWVVASSRYVLFSLLLGILFILILVEKNPIKHKNYIIILLVFGALYSNFITLNRIIFYKDKGSNYAHFYHAVNTVSPFSKHKILASPDTWAPALYLSYYSESKLYDVLKPELLQQNKEAITHLGIDYYFCNRSEIPEGYKNCIQYSGDWVLIKLNDSTCLIKP